MNDERNCLLTRLNRLENENRLHQTYHIQTEKSLLSISNLILRILFIQQVDFLSYHKHLPTRLIDTCFTRFFSFVFFSRFTFFKYVFFDKIQKVSNKRRITSYLK